ncbi:N-acetyltransferase family protein [Acinetobacter sp. ANC 4640]
MKLRVATVQDIPTLVEFGEAFVSESPNYQDRPYEHAKVKEHFQLLIKSGALFVVEENAVICGGFAGGINSDWFNGQKIAFDYVMYVKPEYRKTRAAYLLINAFVNWANLMGADRIQCGTTTGIESKGCIRLYKHFGFNEFGTVLDLELKHE